MEETITFEFIRKVQLAEQRTANLTKIPENFYDAVKAYLQKKKKMEKDRKSVIETKNIERLIENIFNRRERKIINFAIIAARTGTEPKNMIKEEKEFFDEMLKKIKERREKVLGFLKEKQKEYEILVVFKQETPAFVGIDGKTYGPFKKGDIARLPEENKQLLIEQGIVEEFKVEK